MTYGKEMLGLSITFIFRNLTYIHMQFNYTYVYFNKYIYMEDLLREKLLTEHLIQKVWSHWSGQDMLLACTREAALRVVRGRWS